MVGTIATVPPLASAQPTRWEAQGTDGRTVFCGVRYGREPAARLKSGDALVFGGLTGWKFSFPRCLAAAFQEKLYLAGDLLIVADLNGTSPDPTSDSATLNFYNSTAEVYTSSGPGGTNRRLADFLSRLPAKAHVLDLGCGGGRDAERMIAEGFNVDPTDGSPAIAQTAAMRLGRPVRTLQFGELDAACIYDAIWASASLLHVPRQALPDVLRRVWQALKPNGLHFASYKVGETEGRDGHGRYFNYLSRDQLLSAYHKLGRWDVVQIDEYTGGGYEGQQGPWISIIARRL